MPAAERRWLEKGQGAVEGLGADAGRGGGDRSVVAHDGRGRRQELGHVVGSPIGCAGDRCAGEADDRRALVANQDVGGVELPVGEMAGVEAGDLAPQVTQ